MKPYELLPQCFFTPRTLLKKEHGQLYCALSVINELSLKLDTYFSKLVFTENTIEETKEYWIEKVKTYLKDVAGAEDQITEILERYDNKWDGTFESIGDKWHNEGLNESEDTEWRNSIWYLLNMSTLQENRITNDRIAYTSYNIYAIEQWQRDKAVILDYHYQQLLNSLLARLQAPESAVKHSTNAPLNSIEKYKVGLLIYTKLRSFGWSHSNIKPHFAELVLAMLDDFNLESSESLPLNWNDWTRCPLRLFPNLINDEVLLSSSISELQDYHNILDNYIQAKDLRLKGRISRNSIRENLAMSIGRSSSVFNTNIPNQGVDEDKLSDTVNQLGQLFEDVVDERHEREFQKFLDQKASYLS